MTDARLWHPWLRINRVLRAIREVIDRRWDARLVTVKGDEPMVSDRVFHRDGQAICDFPTRGLRRATLSGGLGFCFTICAGQPSGIS